MKQNICDTVIRREIREAEGFRYTYELILREGDKTADWGLTLYSVKISMVDEKGETSEREARDLFTSQDQALEFYNKLVRNLATPLNLGYVVEDELRA